MKKVMVVLAVAVGVFVVGVSENGVTPVSEAEAGSCIPNGGKCAGSPLPCCDKPCTNGVCRN
ncbi:MAG: hypothetical protein U0270_02015 [Labilithrix sp.]